MRVPEAKFRRDLHITFPLGEGALQEGHRSGLAVSERLFEKNQLLRKFPLMQSYSTLGLAQPRATSSFSSQCLFKDNLSLCGKGVERNLRGNTCREDNAIPFNLKSVTVIIDNNSNGNNNKDFFQATNSDISRSLSGQHPTPLTQNSVPVMNRTGFFP